ncbi:MAG: teichoic acid ABC transporter ATP-binding protein [Crocinitomicaceae bacterium]|nr:teichoic acid ABC transporter ATP-binding protein [Crocinitomicaceae bacterium]
MRTSEDHIVFEDVGLSYYTFNQGVNSLKDLLTSFRFQPVFEKKHVLNNLNFTVKKGQTVGILGRNGAGKSTLLKAVAGMLIPSSGKLTVRGNVAPILAIGAGVEMELTGYENIELTGSLIGFSKKELKEHTTKIAAFSELSEKELNMPLKTYSTGMLSRLSFSIAVANEPEILIVDEVLAVGDQGFQQKCIARIQEIKNSGSTILFVSHSVDDIRRICDSTIYLEQGELKFQGDIEEGIRHYQSMF